MGFTRWLPHAVGVGGDKQVLCEQWGHGGAGEWGWRRVLEETPLWAFLPAWRVCLRAPFLLLSPMAPWSAAEMRLARPGPPCEISLSQVSALQRRDADLSPLADMASQSIGLPVPPGTAILLFPHLSCEKASRRAEPHPRPAGPALGLMLRSAAVRTHHCKAVLAVCTLILSWQPSNRHFAKMC